MTIERPRVGSAPIAVQRHCSCGGTCPRCNAAGRDIQPKLMIGAVDDPYEREADAVANAVMRSSAHGPRRVTGADTFLKRSHAGGQRGRASDTGSASLYSAGSPDSPASDESTANQAINPAELTSGGQPLHLDTLGFFQSRFRRDLSTVRWHGGTQAIEFCQRLEAHAFTYGHHIWLGDGLQASPSFLLAHELAHVVQQGHGGPVVRRWPSCVEANITGQDCPHREAGEVHRARAGLVFFNQMRDLEAERTGALVANFDIGQAVVPARFKLMLLWKEFLQAMTKNHATYRLVGFSDCHEAAEGNASLRRARAEAVRQALPKELQSQVVGVEAAPDGQCMRGNVTGGDRGLNRSVALVLESTTIDFGEDEENEAIVGKTPADHLRECMAGARVKTFPFRTTRFGGAPIMARRDGDQILVRMPTHVLHNDDFRKETGTLPLSVFVGGERLDPMEIVRVRHYELPHWYNLNATGDASDDKKTDYCVPAEKLLDFASATNKAFWVNVAVTGVEAVSVGTPVGKWVSAGVSKLAAPIAKTGQQVTIAGMLAMREATPVLGGVASRAPITLVGDVAVEQAATRTVVPAATSAVADVSVSAAVTQTAAPQIGSSLAGTVLPSVAAVEAVDVGGHALHEALEQRELDAAFYEAGNFDEGLFETAQRLIRGNAGERLAADALAKDGHHILFFKPSILGTNQGGIDIVTIRNGVVHFIDNKALSRSGNVASVSALTTNFGRNMADVVAGFTRHMANPALSQSERQLFQEALDAIAAGRYVRVVTNANIMTTSVPRGITQRLANQGIGFIDVMP